MPSSQFHCYKTRFSRDSLSEPIQHTVLGVSSAGDGKPYVCGTSEQAKEWISEQLMQGSIRDPQLTLIVTRAGESPPTKALNVSDCYLDGSYDQWDDNPYLLEQLLPTAGVASTRDPSEFAYHLIKAPFGTLLDRIGSRAHTGNQWPSWLRVTSSLRDTPYNVDMTIRGRIGGPGQRVGDQDRYGLSPPLDPTFFLPPGIQTSNPHRPSSHDLSRDLAGLPTGSRKSLDSHIHSGVPTEPLTRSPPSSGPQPSSSQHDP